MPLRFIFAKPAAVEQDIGHPPYPALGQIVDKFNEGRPGRVARCDPALRGRCAVRVEVLP